MKEYTHTFEYSDLASRINARKLRVDIEHKLGDGYCVIFDLKNVESVAGSYGDELFAILALKYGLESFRTKVKLVNAKPHVLADIASYIKVRLSDDQSPSVPH